VNVLLVGLGRWGERHLHALTSLGATAWVADVAPARLRWAIAQGVAVERAVTDYRHALLQVDAVDIVTPADTHLELASACLGAGRHCFIEKPLATSVEQSRRIVAAADAAGRVAQVGHIFRFHPVTAALRGAMEAGRLGRVRYATGRFSGFKRPRPDVGVTHTDAIHYFDLFAHLLGREATSVTALQRDYLGRGMDDMSLTTVLYGEVPVTVEANYFVPGTHRECVIVGEQGALVADYGSSTVVLHGGEHVRRTGGWEAVEAGKEELPVLGEEPLRLELAAFLTACQGRGDSPVPPGAGVHALEVVEAAARSARLARAVSLAEIR
jgi:predicted dehydrogenase